MKIAILGFGLQSQSIYEFYKGSGNEITVCSLENIPNLPSDVQTKTGADYLKHLDQFEQIYRNPIMHPQEIISANSRDIMAKVTTNTNEFLRLSPTKNIIGVTGTKGKGTTSTLITKFLEAFGLRVHLGGNIGTPPLDLLLENIKADDWVVLELANFQLIDLKYSPHIGVCLIIEPEHLDWHADVNEYMNAKTMLFRQQQADDIAIYYDLNANSKRIASTGKGKLIPYYRSPGALVAGDHIVIDGIPVIRLEELKLIGRHNWQNICAAITAVWQVHQDITVMASVLREFKNLPFRLELRKDIKGVKFYNDSFSSGPTASIAAVKAFNSMKVLILGGKDRNLDLGELCQTIKLNESSIRKVILIGESANRIAETLKNYDFNNFKVTDSKSIDDIVAMAFNNSQPGDSVIFSPGFPSFDMFKDFEDRGIKFNLAVEKL